MSTPAKQEMEVEVEVKELDGGQVELKVAVPPGPVGRARDHAIREFARRANIPGFRKGKAPRALIERYVDQESLRERVISSLVDEAWEAALAKAGITALGDRDVEDAELTEEGGLTFSSVVIARPAIELGEYKGLKVTRRAMAVTDEQTDTEIEKIRARRAKYLEIAPEAPIEKDDLAIVDYETFVEGEKRDDLSAVGYPLVVGSDELFPEMNEALLGAKTGETREFEVAYPETHSDASLAGKTAQFRATVSMARRRQLPDLDDAFAGEVWGGKTLAEMRADIRGQLEAISAAAADGEVADELVRQAGAAASLKVPEALVATEVDRRIEQVEEELDRRGLTLPEYLRNAGRTFEQWRATIEADARQSMHNALVVDEIAERESIVATDDDLNQEIQRIRLGEGLSEEEIHERFHHDAAQVRRLYTRALHRRVVQFLKDHAEITEEAAEPESAERPAEGEAPQPDAAADQGGE